ncbi:hypothetical protein ACFRAU_16285 [Arthrobacter sp. NPDC056691]|uniref:hypothetical protein n=1 Tax=Arthrobacter sp. NPDC056691 TaxID=3345913 RepID=UPI00366C44ED
MSTLMAPTPSAATPIAAPRQYRLRKPPIAAGGQARPIPLEPVPNWCKLSRSDEVTVCRDRRVMASGRVDMVALDGSVFWIIQEDGKGRAMIHQKDGLTVFRKAAADRARR